LQENMPDGKGAEVEQHGVHQLGHARASADTAGTSRRVDLQEKHDREWSAVAGQRALAGSETPPPLALINASDTPASTTWLRISLRMLWPHPEKTSLESVANAL
jgi:hypothetical protein